MAMMAQYVPVAQPVMVQQPVMVHPAVAQRHYVAKKQAQLSALQRKDELARCEMTFNSINVKLSESEERARMAATANQKVINCERNGAIRLKTELRKALAIIEKDAMDEADLKLLNQTLIAIALWRASWFDHKEAGYARTFKVRFTCAERIRGEEQTCVRLLQNKRCVCYVGQRWQKLT
jgi:hypothetical protein